MLYCTDEAQIGQNSYETALAGSPRLSVYTIIDGCLLLRGEVILATEEVLSHLVGPDLLQHLSEAVHDRQQRVSRGNRGKGLL